MLYRSARRSRSLLLVCPPLLTSPRRPPTWPHQSARSPTSRPPGRRQKRKRRRSLRRSRSSRRSTSQRAPAGRAGAASATSQRSVTGRGSAPRTRRSGCVSRTSAEDGVEAHWRLFDRPGPFQQGSRYQWLEHIRGRRPGDGHESLRWLESRDRAPEAREGEWRVDYKETRASSFR